jgi:hypothetical protein
MTGEFVAVSTAAGDAPWSVGRILGFGSSHDLPEGHPDRTAGDGGDFVLVQWCAIVGEEGHARGMPPPDDATKSAGRREIVLLRESSWHPIACILDAVIVLPTCSSHDISGMDGVFVAKFEQGARGTFSRVAADSVGAFPERNATFGVDASGRRLVHVSRTSKLWMVRRMLRTEIHLLMHPSRCPCFCKTPRLSSAELRTVYLDRRQAEGPRQFDGRHRRRRGDMVHHHGRPRRRPRRPAASGQVRQEDVRGVVARAGALPFGRKRLHGHCVFRHDGGVRRAGPFLGQQLERFRQSQCRQNSPEANLPWETPLGETLACRRM